MPETQTRTRTVKYQHWLSDEESRLLDLLAEHRHVSRSQAVRQIIVEEARRLSLDTEKAPDQPRREH